MFSTTDTIVAIATPPGRGGIGVVRISGPDALPIARRLMTHQGELSPRHATLTHTCTRTHAIDQVVVTYFPSPHSYTGEDVVELSAHGSPVVLRAIVESAIAQAARLAEPGEFTLRAFLNGRIDLMQAEAVADLIDAVTPLQARAAFDQLEGTLTRAIADIDAALFDLVARLEASVDFPDEGYHFVEPATLARAIDDLLTRTSALLADARRGRLVREGLSIAIVGRPNVGKSSLFNALVGASRAIVTEVPGTTRDLVTEVVDLEGLRATLIDTAGLHETTDRVEAEGVSRSKHAMAVADLVLVVVDEDEPQDVDNKHLVVQNKSDLGRPRRGVRISATTGVGLEDLRRAIVSALDFDPLRDRPEITNTRHIALVARAHDALTRARNAALADGGALSEEFVLADLQDARAAFEEISGRRSPDDLLAHIFTRFCVGK
ncbi:MAG: tRNA uridine-5-carboxymethylaminomethyl(34) synthesis GTPase MnmE [Acidobacteria bacterium 13_1_40CM_4_65_8]|nr:MAG: tRNA uridine-5-carboxymethylaminomethyl(34) synthesis GTPase MnmE [Acidobacteria bacterium 13_1_40CM_4_65_8]